MIPLLALLMVPAIVVVPVAPMDTSPNQGQQLNGCVPPVNFSLEHDCDLSYADRYSINEYNCGCARLKGDCKGNVVRYNDDLCVAEGFVRENWPWLFIFIGFMILLAMYGI